MPALRASGKGRHSYFSSCGERAVWGQRATLRHGFKEKAGKSQWSEVASKEIVDADGRLQERIHNLLHGAPS